MTEKGVPLDMAEMLGVTGVEYRALDEQIGDAVNTGILLKDQIVVLRGNHDPHALLAGFFIGILVYHNAETRETDDAESVRVAVSVGDTADETAAAEWTKRLVTLLSDLGAYAWDAYEREAVMNIIYQYAQQRQAYGIPNKIKRILGEEE